MIRQATEADIVKVSRLWVEMVKEMKPEWIPNVQWWRRIAEQGMRNGTYFIYVNDEGGNIDAFVDFFIFPEPSTGCVHGIGQHLYVMPSRRDNGLGAILIDKAEETSKSFGAKYTELFCFDGEKEMWEKKGYRSLRTLMRKEVNHV